MRIMKHMALPVLFRELAQLASRRSTYVVRGLCAIALYVSALIMLSSILHLFLNIGSPNLRSVLGRGKEVLMALNIMVTLGVYVILPAMVVGTITTERENGTLELMLITCLSPWEIVLQKLLARLVPMMALLVLSAPFMAVAYGLGGVSVGDIIATLMGWLLASLKLSALAIMCSAICRSTVSAFFATYGLLFAFSVASPFLALLGVGWLQLAVFGGSGLVRTLGFGRTWMLVVSYGLGIAVVAICLLVARLTLVRTGRRRTRGIKSTFRSMDHLGDRVSRRLGWARWRRAPTSLPAWHPVAWREQAAAVVSTPRHLVRLLAWINVPLALMLLFAFGLSHSKIGSAGFVFLMALLWVPVALGVCIYVSNLMSKERVNQTLDVLLTTPLTARQILRQKLAAVPRLNLVIATPLIFTMVAKALTEAGRRGGSHAEEIWVYVGLTLAFMVIYLYALTWITFACSIKPRRRSHVVATAVARVFAIVLMPFLLLIVTQMPYASGLPRWFHDEMNLIMMSPMGLLGALEFDIDDFLDHLDAALINAGIYLGLALWLRARALRWARVHLRKG